MKLEDEIIQAKPFKNEFYKLLLNIAVTNSWLNASFTELLKPHDLSPHQCNVLRILKEKYPDSYSNQEISVRMVDKSSNATRIVDKLLMKDLVQRTENSVDRRSVNIKITRKGLQLFNQIEKEFSSEHNHMNRLDEEKARQMNEWLDDMRS